MDTLRTIIRKSVNLKTILICLTLRRPETFVAFTDALGESLVMSLTGVLALTSLDDGKVPYSIEQRAPDEPGDFFFITNASHPAADYRLVHIYVKG